MPDKSCRTCGGDLMKWSACSECRKSIQKICTTCSVKTVEEIHSHRIHLEPYQIVNAKNTIATVQDYYHSSPHSSKKKSYRWSILVISSVIAGIIILGISSANYLEFVSSPKPSQNPVITPPDNPGIIQNTKVSHADTSHTSADVKYTYNNCLGVSDGTYLTVTCPTTYGDVYKAVVELPSELMSQFESNIFNLRGISVTEHINSISIQYAEKMYEAKFVNS